ncbi:uroporphyrinogen-III C-methyltransferase [Chromohalobacter israelensis]|uniref:Uroporphyrin-3 C-methyltransferase n=1 Tax=Chromohalobacter israelensis (strain ATCC BAA-138 / DSM 3043 / CIP 106854 / NCIMB 13768 / 1H11) TaxID=290398 RepID=Q1QSV7_CHRI1|nr:uroporphyrinogen-III C-methyltransferase [Chromohalobacter salexigens]ABE60451.1 protein of unknown function DUF513, hemX [Chromohalobacter salexigens DSM 3043]
MSKRQDQDDKQTPAEGATSSDETSESPATRDTTSGKADTADRVADASHGASDKAAEDAASSKASSSDASTVSTSGDTASSSDETPASKTSTSSRSASPTQRDAQAARDTSTQSSTQGKTASSSSKSATRAASKRTGKAAGGSSSGAASTAGASASGKPSASKAEASQGTPPPGGASTTPSRGGNGSGRGLAILALVIAVIVAIVVALGLGYGWKRLQAQQAELASAGEENAQTIATLRDRLDQREQAFASLRDDFASYRQDVDDNLDKVLAELAEEQDADPREWLHAEAEYLLRLANQRLRLERDVQGAQALLEAADQRLAEADNPALIPVRRAIQSELAALDSVPRVDQTGLYLALMAQQEQLATLPLKQDVEEIAAQNADDSPLEGGWREQLARLGGELKDLVVVRRHDEALEALMTPEQESYLRQNVRLLLEQAQLALLKTEPKLYRASLDKATTLIERYYDTEREAVTTSLERLRSMRDKTIRPELPDISESQQTLKDFIEKRFQDNGSDGNATRQGAGDATAPSGDEGDSA